MTEPRKPVTIPDAILAALLIVGGLFLLIGIVLVRPTTIAAGLVVIAVAFLVALVLGVVRTRRGEGT